MGFKERGSPSFAKEKSEALRGYPGDWTNRIHSDARVIRHVFTVSLPAPGPDQLEGRVSPLPHVPMSKRRQWLNQLATLLVESERGADAWAEAVTKATTGRRKTTLVKIVRDVSRRTQDRPFPEVRHLVREFGNHPSFARWWLRGPIPLSLPTYPGVAPRPSVETSSWNLPHIACPVELVDFLGLHPDDLNWLTFPGKSHYHARWIAKRRGGRRLLESPKPLLKLAQRRILHGLLHRVPPHECCHGFRPGHDILQAANPHAGSDFLIKMDLADFFPTIGFRRVKLLFMALGYREAVATALAFLTTCSSRPSDSTFAERELYHRRHLPQGAPTSPALANLAAFRLDCRLAGLARAAGARYTRYADDLLFSGNRATWKPGERFQQSVMVIALEEGFAINARKTRTMPKSRRQAALGLVLNEFPNSSRQDFDRLKAILTNCRRHGPESQNLDGHPEFACHLRGRIEWHRRLNARRGEKLDALFGSIDWSRC